MRDLLLMPACLLVSMLAASAGCAPDGSSNTPQRHPLADGPGLTPKPGYAPSENACGATV